MVFDSSRVGQRGVVFLVIVIIDLKEERVVKGVTLSLGRAWCLVLACVAGLDVVVRPG